MNFKALKFSIIYSKPVILLLFISIVNISFIHQGGRTLFPGKNLEIELKFQIMKIEKQNLDKFYNETDNNGNRIFKRLVIQFRATKNTSGALEYKMKGFGIREGGEVHGTALDILSLNPLKIIKLKTPFTLTNVELRKTKIRDFYNSITGREGEFAYLKLTPYVDPNGNVAIEAIAIDTSGNPMRTNLLERAATLDFNPCPPDKPEG